MAHELFYTCCILYMRAWVFHHWVFVPSFPSFLLLYHPSLRYVPYLKTTLRPWDHMSSSTAPTWTGIWDLVDIWISSCFFFKETSFWCLDSIQLWIWITGITCLMMDDLMSPDFLIYHTFDAILGHISFRLRFVDFHGVACSSPLTRITHLMMDDLILFGYSIYHASDAILGHISILV